MKLEMMFFTENRFRMPCVYEFLKNGSTTYVGISCHGFPQVFRRYSNRINGKRLIAFNQADQIRITIFDNEAEARAEKQHLIQQCKMISKVGGKTDAVFQVRKANKERKLVEEQSWMSAGRESFGTSLTSQEFVRNANVRKYGTLWYRMKAAFEEGRRQAIQEQSHHQRFSR